MAPAGAALSPSLRVFDDDSDEDLGATLSVVPPLDDAYRTPSDARALHPNATPVGLRLLVLTLTPARFRSGLVILGLACLTAMLLPLAAFNGRAVTLFELASTRRAPSAWALLCQGAFLITIAMRVRPRTGLRGAALALIPISLATVGAGVLTLRRLSAGLCSAGGAASAGCDPWLGPGAWSALACAGLPAFLAGAFLWQEFRARASLDPHA